MPSVHPVTNPISQGSLSPFRRRIRLLRAWRCAAIGGSIGAAVSVLLSLADYGSLITLPHLAPAAIVVLGLVAGAVYALLEPLPLSTVARSIDQRGKLADRLTSASELSPDSGTMASALHADALSRAASLSPTTLYPLRLSRPHAILAALLLIWVVCYLATQTTVFKSAQEKLDAAKNRQAAIGIQHIARPFLQEAQQPGATPQEKELAAELRRFTADLQRGRMSRQEALVRANQLAEEAKKLTMPHSLALAQKVNSAQTAADKLAQMAQAASMQKSQDAQMAAQEAALAQQVASLEQQLAAAAAGKSKMSAQERGELQKQLAAAQKALQQIRLSEQARQFLEKLESMPDFKEAQAILAKLAAQAAAQQSGDQPEMSPEQMKAMAQRLEQLAKEFGSDAQMKELAQQMLEAAKEAELARNGQLPTNLLQLFGIDNQQPGFGLKGRGGTNPGVWMGGIGHLDKTDKSSLLKVKFKDRIITSQIGPNGPASYAEFTGPSAMGDRSSIPYQAVLPTYRKMAESALSKSDIPARERTRVRDYFDSLRK